MLKKLWTKARFYFANLGNPGKLWHHTLLEIDQLLRLSKVPALPSTLDIEPNNYCNFKCPHCQVTHWDKPRVNLDVERLAILLKQIPHLMRIKLQGMGEPLLNKHLIPMLQVIEARGIKTEIISNGSVMTDAIRDGLLNQSTDITFSIDGATEEVFEKVRVGSSFKKVIENIKKISEQRLEKTNSLQARTVVTKDNVMQLSEIVRLVSSLRLDKLTFQLVLNSWAKNDMEKINSHKRIAMDNGFESHIKQAQATAEQLGLALDITSDDKYSRQRKCNWPWKSAYIASNGDVVPCCILADSDTVKMGNVFEQDFKEIWNSESYQTLRKQIRDHELPQFCKNCYQDA